MIKRFAKRVLLSPGICAIGKLCKMKDADQAEHGRPEPLMFHLSTGFDRTR